ncbi:DUF4190 domain-containing protein [Virgibacillus byunsanensis]|uniref:DUF4190 domain-containing protein n=1 Tax=Virgibacillus byunsanensis TaxID=570945 RepID=A0ABW3LQL3_9BACI
MEETNGKAIASLILGILSIVSPYAGLILGIIGLILASISIKEIASSNQQGRGLAVAGRVCSIVGICINGLIFLFMIAGYLLFTTF